MKQLHLQTQAKILVCLPSYNFNCIKGWLNAVKSISFLIKKVLISNSLEWPGFKSSIHAIALFVLHSKDRGKQRPILMKTRLPGSQNHCCVIPCFVLMLLPWQQRGSTKVAWGWVSPRVHHTSAHHRNSWAHLHWLSTGLSPSARRPCKSCCVPLDAKRKSSLMYPVSYSDFTHPSHLPLLFLATWHRLSCRAWFSCLATPASPLWAHGGGGCTLDGGCSSHEWLPCCHSLGKSEMETWTPSVEATN